MTRELLNEIENDYWNEKASPIDMAEVFDLANKALEQEPTTRNCFGCKYSKDNHNAGTEECHLCMWENQYTPTTKNDLGVDCISRADAIRVASGYCHPSNVAKELAKLPSVTPQEPKTGHCKDCKWWKDSDGEYRRGCGAESKCPINRREVFEGNAYCYLYEPQESENKE